MWYETLPSGWTWASLWTAYISCGNCSGIRTVEGACPACAAEPYNTEPTVMLINGREVEVHPAFAGAEGRYEDYVYLQMLQREWERPEGSFEGYGHLPPDKRPSARAALVLLFWSYFETRIERLIRTAARSLPKAVLDDALDRYSAIGALVSALQDSF